MKAKIGFWSDRTYHLDKMTLRELVAAYFQYYAIISYIIIGIISTVVAVKLANGWQMNAIAAGIVVVAYPLIWYILHRTVLHGKLFFKSKLTAKVWKRIHYDHHQDPHDLKILFGALYTTLPTIALIAFAVGYPLNGWSGAAAALAGGMFTTCFYEFSHCIQHLSYKPKQKWLAHIKQLHMAHHFHDEDGNFGITNFFWDKLFGTFYERRDRPNKSPTVFNLGYTEVEAEKYPWVKDLSGGLGPDNPRARRNEP